MDHGVMLRHHSHNRSPISRARQEVDRIGHLIFFIDDQKYSTATANKRLGQAPFLSRLPLVDYFLF
jgi:hypothetical protein